MQGICQGVGTGVIFLGGCAYLVLIVYDEPVRCYLDGRH